MQITFKEIPIEALCTRVTSGSTPLRSRSDYYENGTIDWFKTGELNDWFVESSSEKITQLALQETSVKVFPAGTVLIAMYGDGKTITTLSMLRSPATTNQACGAMLVDHQQCDPTYFFYALKSRRHKLIGLALGGAQRNLSAKIIKDFCLPVPHLSVQRHIAGILSAYDELIENNQRRIRILEDMARSLYREWFIHFRYSGHESVPLVDSPLGQIPLGWEVKTLGSLMVGQIGGGWGKDVPDEKHTEPAWVIRGTDIPDARSCQVANVPHRFHSISNLRSRRLQAGDIIFEVSGGSKGQPVGRTLLVTPQLLSALGDDAVICASFCKRICPDMTGYGSEMLYLSFLEGYESGEIEQFQVQSTGISNFKWTEYLEKIARVIPPESVRMRFRALVKHMLSQAATLGLQTANLRRTRDLLLPRLLSGQVVLNSNIKEELT